METEAPTVLSVLSQRHRRAADDEDFYSQGDPLQIEEPLGLNAHPRERILANFRVLARTNVFLRAVAAQSASGV